MQPDKDSTNNLMIFVEATVKTIIIVIQRNTIVHKIL